MKYVGYKWCGWFQGWVIVQIIPTIDIVWLILEDCHKAGLDDYLMILEIEPPLPQRFWFKPKKTRRLSHVNIPK